jgi:hypothetical protein
MVYVLPVTDFASGSHVSSDGGTGVDRYAASRSFHQRSRIRLR